MTQHVIVQTDFVDISEFAQGFAERTDAESLMLPSEGPGDEGEWVQFTVYLRDGSPALEGMGRCVASVDNEGQREPHERFDVVLDSLQLEGRAEVVYERILLARETVGRDEPLTGEVAFPEMDSTEMASVDDVEDLGRSIEPTPLEARPDSYLTRPSMRSTWRPEVTYSREPQTSMGVFEYSGPELPLPKAPPRPDPELVQDYSQRIGQNTVFRTTSSVADPDMLDFAQEVEEAEETW